MEVIPNPKNGIIKITARNKFPKKIIPKRIFSILFVAIKPKTMMAEITKVQKGMISMVRLPGCLLNDQRNTRIMVRINATRLMILKTFLNNPPDFFLRIVAANEEG